MWTLLLTNFQIKKRTHLINDYKQTHTHTHTHTHTFKNALPHTFKHANTKPPPAPKHKRTYTHVCAKNDI